MTYPPKFYRNYRFNVEFSASFTKFRYFEECERKYALHTYGSWDKGAEALGLSIKTQFEIRKLKKLDTLDSILGTAVHSTLANLAAESRKGGLSASKNTNRNMKSSITHTYEAAKKSAYRVTLEVLNGMLPTSSEKILSQLYLSKKDRDDIIIDLKEKNKRILTKIERISKNLIQSPVFIEIMDPANKIILIEKNGFPKFKFNNNVIYANIDLAYQLKESKTNVVVDWKTGKPNIDKDKKQLLLYALYITEKFCGGDPSLAYEIFFINEYISVGKRYTHFIDKQELNEFKLYLKDNIKIVKSKLKDTHNNIPLPIGDFAKREEKDIICQHCEMQEICAQIEGGNHETI